MRPTFNKKNRQRGLTLIEFAIAMVLAAMMILGAMKIVPNIQFSLSSSELTQEVNEIRTATISWKASRPGFSGVSIGALCTGGRQLLNISTCGTANDGVGAVAWGGNYSVAVNPSDASRFDVTIGGLPGNRIMELADMLAPLTRNRCSSADTCTTIAVTGAVATVDSVGSITMTF